MLLYGNQLGIFSCPFCAKQPDFHNQKVWGFRSQVFAQ